MVELWLQVAIPVLLIFIGLTAGGVVERRHLRNLAARRQTVSHMLVTDVRTFHGGVAASHAPRLMLADAVVSANYLKSFLAGLKKIFGGELGTYRSLMFRAREEATLRLLEAAAAEGFDAVCNLRLDTADVAGSASERRSRPVVIVSVMAAGTAYRREPNSPESSPSGTMRDGA
ncbi:MAG: YbjQ family protein [Phycisphaerae bacterium]